MSLTVRQEWQGRISRMQWLLNAVIAVECLCIPFFAAGAVVGMVWYGGRRLGADWGLLAGVSLSAAVLFLAAWGWMRLRGRFFSRRDAAAFLDEQMGLHAALSAGEEWGDSVEDVGGNVRKNAVLRVRSVRCLGWLAGGAALMVCGALLPLPVQQVVQQLPDLPPVLAQVEEALDRMAEMESVDGKSLEPFREQLKDLKQMSRNEMYSHAGLEAADALKGKTAAAVAGLSNQMYQADSALSLLDSRNGASSPEAMQSLQEALKGMESLALQPGGIMSRQLQELKGSLPSRQIDPETARRLKEQLERAAQQLRSMCGQCGMSLMASPDENSVVKFGQGQGDGSEPGSGGVSHGRGDAPLAFGMEEREQLDTVSRRAVNEDLSRAALGEAAGVETAAPSPEGEREGLEHGGRGTRPARGGDAVWSDDLTPQEQSALKGIFK